MPGSQKGGTGLGRAISKQFIKARNGSISVANNIETGSAFAIVLNRAG